VITYRLQLTIHDDESETPHEALYRNVASLDVATIRSIDDRKAFDSLSTILRNELVPEGSTVMEIRELAGEPPQSVE